MSIVFVFIAYLFIILYAALYYWSVRQEDIYFDPIPIVPLKENPADWLSEQEDNNEEED